jgi:diadenosine tetraphosphate (Ap4A) HIT family hydrolase
MSCELCALSAPLYRNQELAVVLVDDPAYPGFCRVIWNAHVKEMGDLTSAQRGTLMDAVWQVEAAVREVMQPEKINLASLGNMTPHLHWHVIPRYLDDAHFPQPVWAATQRSTEAPILAARAALLPALRAAILARFESAA